ncbi:hypothetical protein [Gilliamella sp. App6-5]|uniref:hypothetical protein n=1 Tax=Gilliamella sp. App6-5 TaxID=3120232 RepID=UPI0011463B9C|nr:hypothetical protein [Gilliamella apicola]
MSKKLVLLLTYGLLLLSSKVAYGALSYSATTVNSIEGNAPSLNMDMILSINLSDGRRYSKSDNPSSVKSPIELPSIAKTFNDIKTVVPDDLSIVSLSNVFLNPEYRTDLVDDVDGDAEDNDKLILNGEIYLTIEDANEKKVKRTDALDICLSPYKVTLSTSQLSVTTPYGVPNRGMGGGRVVYYIKPKVIEDKYCYEDRVYARPNLEKNLDKWSDERKKDLVTEWEDKLGFKLQDVKRPSSNFPRSGANGLFFKLFAPKTKWDKLSYSKEPANSSINLAISGDDEGVTKIELIGPTDDASKASAANAVPTTFIIYTDEKKTKAVYSFKIDKWYITKYLEIKDYNRVIFSRKKAQEYCDLLGYRLPRGEELTNAYPKYWGEGTNFYPNYFYRKVGGGLFTEWGSVEIDYYPNSSFVNSSFVAYYIAELKTDGGPWVVTPYVGQVKGDRNDPNPYSRAVCVNGE